MVLAADTLSIAVMEIVDNLVMALIPGAMDAGLVNPIFWIGMILALSAAFVAAFPVNRYLLTKGKGHALTHQHHHGRPRRAHHDPALAAGIIGFLLGGLVVSVAAELEDDDATPSEPWLQQPPDSSAADCSTLASAFETDHAPAEPTPPEGVPHADALQRGQHLRRWVDKAPEAVAPQPTTQVLEPQ